MSKIAPMRSMPHAINPPNTPRSYNRYVQPSPHQHHYTSFTSTSLTSVLSAHTYKRSTAPNTKLGMGGMERTKSIRKRSVGSQDSESVSTTSSPESVSVCKDEHPISAWHDWKGIALLLVLYTAQGIPFGLIFGSIPFLLKERVSYAELGAYSLCSMPYSLKLIIAPIIDGGRPLVPLGRRPGWIVPPLASAGLILSLTASRTDAWVAAGRVDILAAVGFAVITFTAMQDVAVDGWSLELLDERNVAYASMCQTFGTSAGYLAFYTAFLALNDPAFCAKYLWPVLAPGTTGPFATLGGAMRLAGAVFLAVSAAVTLYSLVFMLKNEVGTSEETSRFDVRSSGSIVDQEASERLEQDGSESIAASYRALYRIIKLPAVQQLVMLLLIAKAGFSAFDSAVALKLIDYGFPKETIAFIAVIQAPVQLLGTIIVGRWVAKGHPEHSYLSGYALRFILSLTGPLFVFVFSRMQGVVTTKFYASLVIVSVAYGIASDCLMFVAVGAFFLKITSASSNIGGTYLTLLYAAQNLGGMWPKSVTLGLVERLTTYEDCILSESVKQCPIKIDGFYIISATLAVLGALVGLLLNRSFRRLACLPLENWKPAAK